MTQTLPNYQTRPVWQLLFGLIDQPLATFQAIARQPKWFMWAVPLVLIMLSLAALAVVEITYGQEFIRQQIEGQPLEPPPGQAAAVEAGGLEMPSASMMLAMGLSFGTLTLLIGLLAQATFLYFAALVSGGEMTFGSMFMVSVWSRIPMAIGWLAQAGFIATVQRMIEYPGLSFLVASGDMMEDLGNPLFTLLGGIDLFWLWHLLLVVLGLSVVARFSRSKSLVLTLIYAALSLTIALLPTLLFGGMVSGSR